MTAVLGTILVHATACTIIIITTIVVTVMEFVMTLALSLTLAFTIVFVIALPILITCPLGLAIAAAVTLTITHCQNSMLLKLALFSLPRSLLLIFLGFKLWLVLL